MYILAITLSLFFLVVVFVLVFRIVKSALKAILTTFLLLWVLKFSFSTGVLQNTIKVIQSLGQTSSSAE